MTKDKIFIQIDNEKIELKGNELKSFEEDRINGHINFADLENQYKIKEQLKQKAIKKLAETSGLTDEEIAAII